MIELCSVNNFIISILSIKKFFYLRNSKWEWLMFLKKEIKKGISGVLCYVKVF